MRAPLAALAAALLAALALYGRGFFLTRVELRAKADAASSASCAVLPPWARAETDTADAPRACTPRPAFDRFILVIIDAWRYDFAAPLRDASGRGAPPRSPFFHDRMPALAALLEDGGLASGVAARLHRFIADAPTVTMQRLKGLTSGSLPTFLDAGANFASPAIQEDSIVHQALEAVKARRAAALASGAPLPGGLFFTGDDTWSALYPSAFGGAAAAVAAGGGKVGEEPPASVAYPFPSFNVWDLHTVDNGVIDSLFPLLEGGANSTASSIHRWSGVIAHFLGVDHVGHRHGPAHPAMASKLAQMDAVIARLVTAIAGTNTLLVVAGDHGMTDGGHHGGGSEAETDAALLLVSGRRDGLTVTATDEHAPIQQVDLVPTLALALGLPIPFSSLGTPIPGLDYYNATDNAAKAGSLGAMQELRAAAAQAHAAASAAAQVAVYLRAYGAVAGSSTLGDSSDDAAALVQVLQEADALPSALAAAVEAASGASCYAGGGVKTGAPPPRFRGLADRDAVDAVASAWEALSPCATAASALSDADTVHFRAAGAAFAAVERRARAATTTALAVARRAWTAFGLGAMAAGSALAAAVVVLALASYAATLSVPTHAAAAAAKTSSAPMTSATAATAGAALDRCGRVLGTLLIALRCWALFTDTFIVQEAQLFAFAVLPGAFVALGCCAAGAALRAGRGLPAATVALAISGVALTVASARGGPLLSLLMPPSLVVQEGAPGSACPPLTAADVGAGVAVACSWPVEASASLLPNALSWALKVAVPTLGLVAWVWGSNKGSNSARGCVWQRANSVVSVVVTGGVLPAFWAWQAGLLPLAAPAATADVEALHLPSAVLRGLYCLVGVQLAAALATRVGAAACRQRAPAAPAPPLLLSLAQAALPVLLVVSGPLSPAVFLCAALMCSVAMRLHRHAAAASETAAVASSGGSAATPLSAWRTLAAVFGLTAPSSTASLPPPTALLALVAHAAAGHAFHGSGHAASFNALQYAAAYLGFPDFWLPAAATLVALNTLAPFIFVYAVVVPSTTPFVVSPSLPLLALALQAGSLLCTFLFCFVSRQHLMVWSIFAPKFLFDAVAGACVAVPLAASSSCRRGGANPETHAAAAGDTRKKLA